MRIGYDQWAGAFATFLASRGEFVRLASPLVQDFILGLASVQAADAPTPVPALPQPRPKLAFSGSAWPPQAGSYTDSGMVRSAGVLATVAHALAFDEVRAFLVGLTQPQEPTAGQSAQVARAAHALAAVLLGLEHTAEQYHAAWVRLFDLAAGVTRDFQGQTVDDRSKVMGELPTGKNGIYRASAVCGIQRDDGIGGSLTIIATLSKFANKLSLIRSDRLNAQLSPALVGIDAFFTPNADRVQLIVSGKQVMRLSWENHVSMYIPK